MEVYDKDKVGADEFLGEAVLDLLNLGGGIRDFKSRDNLLEHTVKLVPRKGGSLKEAKYVGNWKNGITIGFC